MKKIPWYILKYSG